MAETDVRDEHMRDSDAFSWYMERDPLLRSTIVSVVVLDAPPDADRLRERAERASRLSPGFRHKVVEAPLRLANPRWVVDPDFDLSYHSRHLALPAPGTRAQVFELARQTGMSGFDRDRPLWEFTLLEGLEGGRAALVMKLHHALTDGIGGMEMAQFLFDLEPDAGDPGPMPEAPAGEPTSTLDRVRDALGYDWSRLANAAGDTLRAAPGAVARAARHPVATARDAMELGRSIVRTAEPINTTLSPVMRDRRLGWHYDAVALRLDDLRAAVHAAGFTLNDGFLGAVAGGLLRYHERQDSSIEELRVTMPISIRTPDDPIGGNRITLVRIKVPVGVHDPRERMARVHELCDAARHERAIPYTNAIAGALNLLPRSYVGGMLKHVDFLASNVPGIDVPVYLAGARVAEWYAFGPTIGAALNATLVSYCGDCYVGVNCDTGAIPEPDVMLECLREGFSEVLAVGGDHEGVRRVTA